MAQRREWRGLIRQLEQSPPDSDILGLWDSRTLGLWKSGTQGTMGLQDSETLETLGTLGTLGSECGDAGMGQMRGTEGIPALWGNKGRRCIGRSKAALEVFAVWHRQRNRHSYSYSYSYRHSYRHSYRWRHGHRCRRRRRHGRRHGDRHGQQIGPDRRVCCCRRGVLVLVLGRFRPCRLLGNGRREIRWWHDAKNVRPSLKRALWRQCRARW